MLSRGNLRIAMGGYSLVGGQSNGLESNGLSVTSCGFDSSVFNAAMPTRGNIDPTELQVMIDGARRHYQSLNIGWTFWLCEALLTESAIAEQSSIFSP